MLMCVFLLSATQILCLLVPSTYSLANGNTHVPAQNSRAFLFRKRCWNEEKIYCLSKDLFLELNSVNNNKKILEKSLGTIERLLLKDCNFAYFLRKENNIKNCLSSKSTPAESVNSILEIKDNVDIFEGSNLKKVLLKIQHDLLGIENRNRIDINKKIFLKITLVSNASPLLNDLNQANSIYNKIKRLLLDKKNKEITKITHHLSKRSALTNNYTNIIKRSPLEVGYVTFTSPAQHMMASDHSATKITHVSHHTVINHGHAHHNAQLAVHVADALQTEIVSSHALVPLHTHEIVFHSVVVDHAHNDHQQLYRKHYGGFGVGIDYGGHGAGHGFHVL